MKSSKLTRVWTTCYSNDLLHIIEVQVLIRNGFPRFDIIGLPQSMIREGKDRVLSALCHLGIEMPAQKVLVSLKPGDLPKEGSHFDLPILVGILRCLNYLPDSAEKSFFWGELALDGHIETLDNPLPHLVYALSSNPTSFTLNGPDGLSTSISSLKPIRVASIQNVTDLIKQEIQSSEPVSISTPPPSPPLDSKTEWLSKQSNELLWNQMKGSSDQFLFWILAMLGRHHVLLEGPPGVGKSSWCLAARDVSPPISKKLIYQRARFRAVRADSILDLMNAPFESPHHSSSRESIVGGGSFRPSAGACSRAHAGILFLDEMNEFNREALEALREPLESKKIVIGRASQCRTFDADFQILATMNPCACGNRLTHRVCICRPAQLERYRNKISGPLRDRFHSIVEWNFVDEPIDQSFHLKILKVRVLEILRTPRPAFESVAIPRHLNPRRQRHWLQFLQTWSWWHGDSTVTQRAAVDFSEFLLRTNHSNYEKENYIGYETSPRRTGDDGIAIA